MPKRTRPEITQNKVPKFRGQNYAESGANINDPVILLLFQKQKKRLSSRIEDGTQENYA